MKIYLDLLPQEKKNELNRKKIFRRILQQELLFLLPFLVLIMILANIYYILSIERSTGITAGAMKASQSKYQELSSYDDKFSKTNDATKVISKIQQTQLYWLNALRELARIAPDGLTITNFSTKNYQIFLVGKAKTRDDLLNFKTSLENSTCFGNVNVPLSNLVVKDDVDFQMDLVVNQDCLKKT